MESLISKKESTERSICTICKLRKHLTEKIYDLKLGDMYIGICPLCIVALINTLKRKEK